MSSLNPYLDPRSTYGLPKSLYDTGVSRKYGMSNPQAEYTRMLAMGGLGGLDRMSQFAGNQFGKVNQGYQAALLTNPTLQLRDYLGGLNLNHSLIDQYRNLSAGQRGLDNASRVNVIRTS